jgi:predicted enzyme related to lactoylglutathione lyase
MLPAIDGNASADGGATMREDGKLDYLELPAADLVALKAFYSDAFGWRFTDYGPTYAAFDEGLAGGFQADAKEGLNQPLPVLYARDLETMQAKVRAAGGRIIRPIFSFPGGRRFHFTDPSGNALAVASYDEA